MFQNKLSLRKPLTFLLDMLCVFGVVLLNLSLQLSNSNIVHQPDNKVVVILYLITTGFILLLYKCYNDAIQDYSLSDTLKIGGAIITSVIILAVCMYIIGQPLSVFFSLNLAVYTMVFCAVYRLIFYSVYRLREQLIDPIKKSEMQRVIIFGAGDAGKYLVNMLRQDKSKKMVPVAFMDDDPRLERKKIKGLLVVGPRMLIPYAAKKYNAETILIAIPFVDNSTIREIFNLCCAANCTVKRFGNMSNLAFDGLAKSTINEVRVEDLLQRQVVRLDLESVSGLIKNKIVLVTGGAGSIGSELCKQILNYSPKQLIIFDFSENGLFEIAMDLSMNYRESMFTTCIGSVRDVEKLDAVFKKYRPQIVFHAAAYKHVPMMEGNFREALINNVQGTWNVTEAAISNGAERFILISTDKAVNPTNIMGATKRIAELIIQRQSRRGKTLFAAVRFGNVLGSNCSVVPIFQKQIRKGGPITVTDKGIKRYFMTIPEAVQLVLEAASITQGGEIFVLDMGEPVNIYDLAVTMIKLSGLEPDKDISIKVTGLRPGEKLFEELRLSEETVNRTSNDKIFVLKSGCDGSYEETESNLDKLFSCIQSRDYVTAFGQMKILIPSFKSDVML